MSGDPTYTYGVVTLKSVVGASGLCSYKAVNTLPDGGLSGGRHYMLRLDASGPAISDVYSVLGFTASSSGSKDEGEGFVVRDYRSASAVSSFQPALKVLRGGYDSGAIGSAGCMIPVQEPAAGDGGNRAATSMMPLKAASAGFGMVTYLVTAGGTRSMYTEIPPAPPAGAMGVVPVFKGGNDIEWMPVYSCTT